MESVEQTRDVGEVVGSAFERQMQHLDEQLRTFPFHELTGDERDRWLACIREWLGCSFWAGAHAMYQSMNSEGD